MSYPTQGAPPKRCHPQRNIPISVAVLFTLGLTSATVGGCGSKSTPAASSPAASDPAFSQSARPVSAAPSPPPFSPQTLLNVSGSGQYTTAKFTVGASGDYDVDWTYSEGSFEGPVNFQFFGDGGSDFKVTDPNQIGAGGSGVVHVYGDGGAHYLKINSEGAWTVKVVTRP